MLFSPKPKPDITLPDEIGGVPLRVSARAKRLALRVDPKSGDVVLTWPKGWKTGGAREKNALRFIAENRLWIAKHNNRKPQSAAFAHGAEVALNGVVYKIEHRAGRGLTRIENDMIVVHGDSAHLARRLRDFLKAQALAVLTQSTHEKSARLGLPPAEVTVRDPKSRWGSCGVDGKIMFSWRLILAPPAVMDYIVAHEVAHRRHMNHSARFWQLCYSLCDHRDGGGEAAKYWLKKNGSQLMRYA